MNKAGTENAGTEGLRDFGTGYRSGSMASGLREQGSGIRGQGSAARPVTGRCENKACGRLAYGHDPLCPICRAELAYRRQVEALGIGRRYTETAESRALDRWLRRKEWRTRLRSAGDWALGIGLGYGVLYLGWKFGAMFLAWAVGN